MDETNFWDSSSSAKPSEFEITWRRKSLRTPMAAQPTIPSPCKIALESAKVVPNTRNCRQFRECHRISKQLLRWSSEMMSNLVERMWNQMYLPRWWRATRKGRKWIAKGIKNEFVPVDLLNPMEQSTTTTVELRYNRRFPIIFTLNKKQQLPAIFTTLKTVVK